jgi:hypothetical protein
VFVRQATQGVFSARLVTGLLLLSAGTLAYAVALVDTTAAAASVVALIVWYLTTGGRALRSSTHEDAEGVAGRIDVDA